MKESILSDLYLGKINPCERERICSREHDAVIEEIDGIAEHFKNWLSPEEYAKFEEMQNLQAQAELIDNTALFKYSFCLGALMMIDIFSCREHD